MFCRRIITRPTPNSTADKIRKKKVSDKRFTLSYNNPTNKTKTYKVTQRNSAVSIKCKAVFIFITILVKIKKKISNIKFTSPINIRSLWVENVIHRWLVLRERFKLSYILSV
jgi:hypothetical protein